MKIGNIVSPTTISVSEDFNVVGAVDKVIDGLPTLIIGWDYIKQNFPDYNILNRTLGPNIFWTFKRSEKRDWFEEDLFNFTEHSYKSFISNTTYIFLDLIIFSKKKVIKILRKIYSSSHIISYEHDSMIYIYLDNFIFGIDLNQLMFLDMNVEKIKTRIKRVSSSFLTKEDIFIKYKTRIEYLDNQWKFVPYLYQKENG
jgi:hypothetical protein